MIRLILGIALLGAVAVSASAAQTKAPTVLKSVNVTLPDSSQALPDGPNLSVVDGNCVSCHSAGMILNQPAMSKATWEAEVAKMRNVFKAPIDEKDVAPIVDYLTAVKGPK